jgi:protein-tyrosine-phosphatase
MTLESNAGQQLAIRQAAKRLRRQFESVLSTETIDRFMTESVDVVTARVQAAERIPLLAERLAQDRLRALVRLEVDRHHLKPSVLFLCVHNAGRSQMAGGFMRHFAGDSVDVFSGGSEPADQINAAAIAAMAEKGIDISQQLPQPWAAEIVQAADVVVTMGCGDACPVYPGKRYIDWEIEDPSGKTVDEVRLIRDNLERKVTDLLAELTSPPAAERRPPD